MTINRTRLILIVWLLLVVITLGACSQVELFEDGSARVFGHGICLDGLCGEFGDPELLQSHDLSAGYLIIGRYTPYDQGGTALCYHDFNVCILSRVE